MDELQLDTFTIEIHSKDVSMLRRIAQSDKRRFSDFVRLIFAQGLDCYFCDEIVCVEKLPDEYTIVERIQQDKNKQLIKECIDHSERIAGGYSHVSTFISNYTEDPETGERKDVLIDPMTKRIHKLCVD